jgi:hypothetical protein
MHLLFGTNSLCLFAQPLLFLASVLHLKLTFSVLRINNYFPASVVSQKAPLIICAYVKVRLIEMQYIIIIIIKIFIFQLILLYKVYFSTPGGNCHDLKLSKQRRQSC